MTNQTAHEKYVDQGNLVLEKFTPFFIGLTFSILALSVQLSITPKQVIPTIAEMAGWIALLTSGIVGLRHFQWQQVFYMHLTNMEANRNEKKQFIELKIKGTKTIPNHVEPEMPIDKAIEICAENEKISRESADKLADEQISKATWQRRAFYVGIISLMIARGWEHIVFILAPIS